MISSRFYINISCISVFIAAAVLQSCSKSGAETCIYGNTPQRDYLTGRFYPAKHRLFVSLSDLGIPTNNRKHYLRIEAAKALKRLYDDFHKQHPKIPLWVRSSTRNFYDQKYIWESKWTGRRTVSGKRLDKELKDPIKRAREILKYSSMPGTSRHHWGTDFDINILRNSFYSSGNGKIIYGWLKKNAHRYGFCQPYSFGRKEGYCEERWHWSYMPLSKKFLSGWNTVYKKYPDSFSKKGLFLGSGDAGHLAAIYVNAINGDCKGR